MRTGSAGLGVTVDQRDIQAAVKALKSEADGKTLRKELSKDIKAAAAPLVVDLKSAIRAVGTGNGSPPITGAIATQIKPVVRIGGRDPMVSVKAGKVSTRGFNQAARSFNARSFRHRVYGGPWVTQVGRPRWFDDTANKRKDEFRDKVMDAVEAMAKRISSRAGR